MNDPLRDLFHYHTWATLTLLDHCAALPSDVLNETAAGTMGTIRETFVHLIEADAGYQARMRADNTIRIKDAENLSLSELRARFVDQSRSWESILDQLDGFDPNIEAHDDYPEIRHARNLLLAQTLHHGNDHRTHICTVLGANGHEVPWTDVWSFWIAPDQG